MAHPPADELGLETTRTSVARLLGELRRGDPAAMGALFDLLYGELRELARRQRLRWRGDYTLNTTALLHEAYLKLAPAATDLGSRAHFLALAASAMRQILCNYARDRRAMKRGGGAEVMPFDEWMAPEDDAAIVEPSAAARLVELDDALQRLERVDPRQARVVECRFFGGLTVEETANALGVSARTVKRDWSVAQAWLQREMTEGA